MVKHFRQLANISIATLLSIFGLCDCGFQKNEYGCPSAEFIPKEEVDNNSESPSNNQSNINSHNNNVSTKEEELEPKESTNE